VRDLQDQALQSSDDDKILSRMAKAQGVNAVLDDVRTLAAQSIDPAGDDD